MNFQLKTEENQLEEEKNVVINLLVFQEQPNSTEKQVKSTENQTKPYQLIYLPEKLKKTTQKIRKPRKTQENKQKIPYKLKKKLNVGWLHCPKEGKKFTQVRAINGGGLKYMELTKDDKPNLNEFLALAKRLFFNDKSITPYGPMDEMDFYIGNFEGDKIINFTNENGDSCDVWEYMQSRGLSPSRINFYLLSQSKDGLVEIKEEIKDKSENEFYVLVPNTLKVTFMMKFNDVSDRIINMLINCKSTCLSDAKSRKIVSDKMDLSDFHPTQCGYEIIQIQLGDKIYFNVDYENDFKKISFHLTDESVFKPHTIIHQPDDLLGLDDDGNLATALICSCDDDCCPLVTWFCDGEVYASGIKLFYVTLSKSATYHCQVKCNEMCSEIVSNVLTVYK